MNAKLKARLEEVRSLLGSAGAAMSFAKLLTQLTELSVTALKAKKFGKKVSSKTEEKTITHPASSDFAAPTSEPNEKSPSSPKNKRYISQKTQHFIWQRDHSRCTNCGSTRLLNVDHIKPIAHGGTAAHDNLRLLCFACNQRAGIQIFGVDRMGARE